MAARLKAGLARCTALGIALLAPALVASEGWVHLTAGDFDLYSSMNGKESRALLRQLEAARSGLERFTGIVNTADSPLRVVAFRSESQFRAYRADGHATAYFLQAPRQSYIVLGGESFEGGMPVVHEYVHYIIHQQYRNLPLWLEEGLADVYSTVRQKEGWVQVGLPPEGRLDWLRMDGLAFPLSKLLAMQQGAIKNVSRSTPGSRFYAESWLLVHMLRLSREYEGRFTQFMRQLENGTTAEQSLQAVWGKSLDQVSEDLKRYLEAEHMPTEITRAREKAIADAVPLPLDPAETSAVLGDLRRELDRTRQAHARAAATPPATAVAGTD